MESNELTQAKELLAYHMKRSHATNWDAVAETGMEEVVEMIVTAAVAEVEANYEGRLAAYEMRVATCEGLLKGLVDAIRKEVEKRPRWDIGP